MSIFKESFKPEIRDQLKKRQEAISKRTPSDIQYFNSRNAWIRMSSAVNVNGSNDLAKSYILQGGTLNASNTLKSGVGSSNETYSSKTPYGTTHRLGIRPMPGITSIDVTNKSAYGSLRQVIVNFQCWDIKQLEELELLYMRPGYSVLIEWGWIPYLSNSGTLTNNITPIDIINENYNKEKLFDEIFKKSLSSSGNYDAMYGRIMNYSWSARVDGGYDCQTTIISIGEVLESLKINYVPSTLGLDNQFKGFLSDKIKPSQSLKGNSATEIKDAYSKNILAGIFKELYYIISQDATQKYFKNNKLEERVGILNDDVNQYEYFYKELDINNSNISKENLVWSSSNKNQAYISLKSLINLLNKYVILRTYKDLKNPKSSTEYVKLSVTDRDNKDLLCLAHPLQISVNPTVCLINSTTWSQIKIVNQAAGGVDPESGAPIIKFNSNIKNVDTFVDDLIRNTIPAEKINNKEALKKFIADTILGPVDARYDQNQVIQNINEVNRIYISKYNNPSYTIKLPNKSATFSIVFNPESVAGQRVNRSLISTVRFSNLYSLLNASQGANLSSSEIAAILTQEGSNIANTDPIVEEQAKIDQANKESAKLTDAAKESTEFLSKLSTYFYTDQTYNKNGLGIIGNIFVNLQLLYTLSLDVNLESQDKKEKKEINAYDFLKTIMNQIAFATGNINNFDIFIDNDVARIIDINYTNPTSREATYDDAFVFEMQNTNSIVRTYQLESQIFPEQSTMIAIGAQVRGGALGSDVNTLTAFNSNVEDRIMPYKDTDTNKNLDNPNSNINELTKTMSTLTAFFKDFSKLKILGLTFAEDFDFDKAIEYENALKDLIGFFISITDDDMKNRAIIPTRLSLDIDGIGGMIIGNIFRIPDEIMPKGYKGIGVGAKLGYLVTNLGHTLQNNDWVTKIVAQTFILDQPTGLRRNFDYKNITLFISPETGGTITTTVNTSNSGAGSVAEDSSKYPVLVKFHKWKQDYSPSVQKNAKVSEGKTPVANSLRQQLNKQYITEKGEELSSNGDITEGLKSAILNFQSKLISNKETFSFVNANNPIVITAGNDTFHRTYNDSRNKTTHSRGLAIDIKTSTFNYPQIGNIMNLLRESGFVYVIYHGGTALHIHANIKTD